MSAQIDKSLHLNLHRTASDDVEVQAVLDSLRLRHGHEVQRDRATRGIRGLELTSLRREVPHPNDSAQNAANCSGA